MPDHARPDDTGLRPERTPDTGIPRWVKISAILVAVIAILIIAVMLIGGGEHGPGRHTTPASTGAPSTSDDVPGHTPPAGVHP